MRRLSVLVASTVLSASVLLIGCSQAAPPPAPTQAPAPPKAAEPTKAPVAAPAQPTAAPAKKVDFPQKGKPITVIVPTAAGGGTDVAARAAAPLLEQELGTQVQVVNKTGGGAQVGLTELATSKPDGYTIGYTIIPTVITTYLDPERKAVFSKKDFLPVGTHFDLPYAVVVHTASPYKTLKDLIDAAKANPETIKAGTTGLLAQGHVTGLMLEKETGVKFAAVHFDGSAPQTTALLGRHVDVGFNGVAESLPHVKSGNFRVLGVTMKEESPDLPGVKTVEAQGYRVYSSARAGISAPAGTPKEVADVLAVAIKKVIGSDQHKKKLAEVGIPVMSVSPEQFAAAWDEMETVLKPLIEQARKK